jgi:ABC-type uncharacterized transport system YnjBCD ATPase subunit
MKQQQDSVQFAILIVYLTFIFSGIVTLYINMQFQFFGAKATDFTQLALVRNVVKQIGILFVSWWLYKTTRKGR